MYKYRTFQHMHGNAMKNERLNKVKTTRNILENS